MKLQIFYAYIGLLLFFLLPSVGFTQWVTPGVVSPSNQTIVSGAVPAPLTATAPTGGSGQPPYIYTFQWQSSPNGSSWTDISGATNGSGYAPGALTSTTSYKLMTTQNGSLYVSNTVIVTVSSLQGGTISPGSVSINFATNPGQLSGTAASGGNGTYAYQWQRSTNNANWVNISSATAVNFSPGGLVETTYFRRQVNSNGAVATSNVATVNVYAALDAGYLSPGSTTIAINTSPGALGGATASGGNGTYTYQWQKSTDNANWANIAGATTQDYNPGNLNAVTWYRRIVTSNGLNATSAPIVISLSQTVTTVPNTFAATIKMNTIRSWEAQAPEQNPTTLVTRPLRDVKQTSQYFDGLGRELQTVIKQGSLQTGSSPVDWVTANIHDRFGRQVQKYLPFAANNTGGNTHISDGIFKLNPLQQQSVHCLAQYPGETFYYNRSVYEPSPLTKIEKEQSAGNNWVGSDRGVTTKYLTNTTTDSVKIWTVTNIINNFGSYSSPGNYAAGELYKNIISDEQGKQTIEVKDKQDRMLLKKVQLTAAVDDGTGKGHVGWLCTYYMYDEFDNLRCVVQPKGVDFMMAANWVLTDPVILAEQCYRYEYDHRQRTIRKQVPGGGAVWMVYDARDRIVLSQDANLRAGTPAKWQYTLYDNQNRPLTTGLWNNNQTQEYHAAQAAGSTGYPNLSGQTYEELSVTHYDDYNNLPGGFSSTVNSSDATTFFTAPYNASPDYALPFIQSFQTTGLVTWTKTKILGSANFIHTVKYYDDKGRIIQEQTQNITGGTSIISTQYNFAGQVLKTVGRHIKAGTNSRNIPLCTKNTYDDLGRLAKIEKRVDFTGALKTIAVMEYNAQGKLKTKKLGTDPITASPLETQSFDYNIREWLLGANRSYLTDTLSTLNYFGYDLGYDKDQLVINSLANKYGNKQFNGNAAGLIWKSTGDDRTRKYDYTYDAGNRVTHAQFNQLTGSSFSKAAGIDYSVSGLTFDGNGNMLSMLQKGWVPGGSRIIDSLSYNYITGSNRLKNVMDAVNDTATRLGDFRASNIYSLSLGSPKTSAAIDYAYDANGNMVTDKNKDITAVQYNYLNLPAVIRIPGKGTITYTYTASGQKLKKETVDSTINTTTTTLYLDGFVYESRQHFVPLTGDYTDSLLFTLHEEGRIRISGASHYYDYFIKDHLSNVRLVLTEQQQTDAYPAASMEIAPATAEESLYANLPATRSDLPPGYPTDTYTNPNNKVAKLRGDGQKIGPAILLKVMAGDKFNLRVSSWYKLNGSTPGSPVSPLTQIVTALGSSIPGVSGGKVASGQLGSFVLDPGIINYLNNRDGSYLPSKPKGYVNYILLDEQFNPVITNNGKNTGFDPVGADQEFKVTTLTNREITKNGYLYIYVSNETPNIDVFFDNLQVTHIRGPILEETHYYPYGLVMKGISSRAFGAAESKYELTGREKQGKEMADGSGLELYDFGVRMYDAQIGRWHVVDGASEQYYGLSPYAFTGNNPVNAQEMDGNLFIFVSGFMPSHYLGGENPTIRVQHRELIDKGISSTWYTTEPNPNRYAPNREFYKEFPRNNGKPFAYWERIDRDYIRAYKDKNAWYINASFTPQSEASTRFNEGLKAGKDLITKLDAGVISLAEGETIKIVGHSQGAAYAAGIATELAKHAKYASRVEFVDYLSAHQPGEFTHPANIPGRQFSTFTDQVSSDYGFLGHSLNLVNGRSSLQRISGVHAGIIRYGYIGRLGGHMVGTWHKRLLAYWASLGIPITFK